MAYIFNNSSWIIPAVISFLGVIVGYLAYKKKEANRNNSIQSDSSVIIKISGKATNNNFNTTINKNVDPNQIKIIAQDIYELNFPKLRSIAAEEAKKNISNFSNILTEKLRLNSSTDNRMILSPDFQFDLYKAIEIGARFDNSTLHDLLANLLSKKIEYSGSETTNLVLSESIITIGKLSANQMKILTFAFMLLEYIFKEDIDTWEAYNRYFDLNVRPFMNFIDNEIDFKHLEYSGCIKFDYGFAAPNLPEILKNQIPTLFPDLSSQMNKKIYLEKIVADNFNDAKIVDNIILKANFWAVSSTSVGIMLASSYYEKMTGIKLAKMELYYK